MKKTLLSAAAISLFASGYKVPEQSLNAIALSGAYVANSNGADAAYYNPANMAFNENKNFFELTSTLIHLNKVLLFLKTGKIQILIDLVLPINTAKI